MAYEYTNIIDLYNIQKSVSQKFTVYMYVYQSKHQFNFFSVYQNLLAL